MKYPIEWKAGAVLSLLSAGSTISKNCSQNTRKTCLFQFHFHCLLSFIREDSKYLV